MIDILLSSILLAAPPVPAQPLPAGALRPAAIQDPEERELPPPAVVEEALIDLKKAAKLKDPLERAAALTRNTGVVHPDVIDRIAKAIGDRSDEVVGAAFDALRRMDHPDALKVLHKTFKRSKTFRKKPELYASLAKAIGQHQSASSVSLLASNAFGYENKEVIEARILALGNIRTVDTVESLMGMLRGGARRNIAGYMDEFRMSLMLLTGTDRGMDPSAWIEWWNKSRKKFELRAEAFKLPKAMQYRWDRYWGNDMDYDRGTRREERGKDPERDASILRERIEARAVLQPIFRIENGRILMELPPIVGGEA